MPVSDKAAPERELHFLLELETENVRSRWRGAVSGSIVAHVLILALLIAQPKFFHSIVAPAPQERAIPEHLTYLALPPDRQVVKAPPKTDIVSDKNRLARPALPDIRVPKLPPLPPPAPERPKPREERREVAEARPVPAPPQITPQKAPEDPLSKVPEAAQAAPPPQPQLQLQDVPKNNPNLPVPAGASHGTAIEQAMRSAAKNRASGTTVSDLDGSSGGPLVPKQQAVVGDAQILSDTMGVDFSPYLRRIVADIKRNWYAVMPEAARLGRRGRVIVTLDIERNGMVPKLFLVSASGSEPLDRAALAGISASVPFPPLPPEFRGPVVRLQVTFLYNYASGMSIR